MNKASIEKMRYQFNSSGKWFVLLALTISTIALFSLINYDTFRSGTEGRVVPDMRIGIEITIGIIIMLMLFLASEKVKVYDYKWALYGLNSIAVFHVWRAFRIPYYAFEKGWIPATLRNNITIGFILTAVLLVIASFVTLRKITLLRRLKDEA
jgi:hypothetical protein